MTALCDKATVWILEPPSSKHDALTNRQAQLNYPEDHALRELEKRAERVHCLLGFPIDMVTMNGVLAEIAEAIRTRRRLFISTANLNFVTQAQTDEEFRKSLRSSNLCVADGIAVKVIGSLLGMPIPERVAGSDILSAIWNQNSNQQVPPLKVFFFGGTEEAGCLACEAVNRHPSKRIVCVGSLCPGYGSVEDMSSETTIQKINTAEPDFLIVSLGARKGQAWITRNMDKLDVPVISHLGATINFLAGTLKRAPIVWQRVGLEWLWRIKEEPALARRYWQDFLLTSRLMATRILPLAIRLRYKKLLWGDEKLSFVRVEPDKTGDRQIVEIQPSRSGKLGFENLLDWSLLDRKKITIRLNQVNWIDTRSMGRLLLLGDLLERNGYEFQLVGLSDAVSRDLRLNGQGDFVTRF